MCHCFPCCQHRSPCPGSHQHGHSDDAEKLSETLYDASLAGIGGQIYSHLRGFGFRITGYNDKQETLLKRIVATLNEPQFDQLSFERIRQSIWSNCRTALRTNPTIRPSMKSITR
ncbi:hypothetical protein [Aliamphritea spongicola]